ncbi:MAG TPA: family 78 glycoside hydrolase catalytic domain [Acidimicrobiales bacterium]|nr:family 78 glycoside hydrolase catalytic domain [Acidimicrobiales bacterium]
MTAEPPPGRQEPRLLVSRRRVLQLGLAGGAAAAVGPGLAGVARGEAVPARRPPRAAGAGEGPGAPTGLRTSGLVEPLGLGADDVFFSWHVDDAGRGAVQSAYRVVVTGPPRGAVWDSGRVASDAQAFVPYAGPPLRPDSVYAWTVRTWDGTGRPGPFSSPARFETGLADADWGAQWVRRLTVEAPDDPATFQAEEQFGVWPARAEYTYVRREAVLGPSPVVRARVYVSADQLYELYVNGSMVGKGQAYQFPDSQYYETWDVTHLLRPGRANAFGILYTWQGPAKGHPAGAPGVIARVTVDHDDGGREVVVTDASWRVLPGPWVAPTQRDEEGDPVDYTEHVVGPAVPTGWDRPGFVDAAWAPATVIGEHPARPWSRLVPVRTRQAFRVEPAARLTRLPDGAVVADFGRVYAALPQVRFHHGVPGRVVTMHAGYVLDASGRVSTSHGNQHTDMSYAYVQRGGVETFRSFDYLGFRYLQIDDPGEAMDAADVAAVTKHVAVPDEHAATFRSSDSVLDAVFELGRHSALYTMQEQFVDTPTREKGSWLWDGRNESMTALAAFGDHNQTRKSLLEFAQSQARYWPNGAINKIYPTALGALQLAYFTAIYPEWVWNYWLHTGDRALLTSLYPVVLRVAGFLHAAVEPRTGLITDIPSDTDVPMHPTDTLMNLLAVNVFRRVAAMGAVLGRPRSEIDGQQNRRVALTTAVNRRLSRPDGLYWDGLDSTGVPVPASSQSTNAYALSFGVVPPARAGALADHVAGQGLATEPMMAADVLEALRTSGHAQAVLDMVTDVHRPGWANILARGGTFTWEVWDPTDTDAAVAPLAALYPGNSMSHGWGSNVLAAIQRTFLAVAPTGPGFSTFSVTVPRTTLGAAAGRVPTPAGPVTVAWTRSAAGEIELDLSVPANTAAEVVLAGAAGHRVEEGGRPLASAAGVGAPRASGDALVVPVGAGTYRFTSRSG